MTLRKKYFGVTCLVLCLLSSLTGISYGKVLRVPLEHNTIQAAIDAAASGDTVKVDAGVYMEKITMKERVDVIGGGAEYTSIIHGEYFTGYVVTGATNCTLKGFTISSGNTGGGVGCPNVSSMNISCNIIKNNNTSNGIDCNRSSLTIINNKIINCSTGIYHYDNSSCIIKNNIISDMVGGGISGNSNCIISNNIIRKCGYGTSSCGYDILSNNIITNCSGCGITKTSSWSCWGVLSLFYNNVWNNNPDYNSDLPKGSYDISIDPLFVDPNNGDFHLKPNSPCRDAGSPEISFNDPDGSRNDMGAYGGPGAADWKTVAQGLPVVTNLIVSPNPVARGGKITIKATGKIQP